MSTYALQAGSLLGGAWQVAEQPAVYASKDDALLLQFKAEAAMLTKRITDLSRLDTQLNSIEESRLVFALEALLDMRRELLNEARSTLN